MALHITDLRCFLSGRPCLAVFPSPRFPSSHGHLSPTPTFLSSTTMRTVASALSLSLLPLLVTAAFSPVREYKGQDFFSQWDFDDKIDDTTWGNVTYLGAPAASAAKLVDVNAAGNVIIKVDNTTVIQPASLVHRNSVRITSKDTYGVGNVIIADFVHMPYGCSVWPSFWLLGQGAEWPNAGEIDIVEGINLYENNQFSLHTPAGCQQPDSVKQTGRILSTNCESVSGTNKNGCITEETKPNSFGKGFAQAGGGVFALQIDVTGIFMWFWTRAEIPKSITSSTSTSTLDLTDWGNPSAAYPAVSCNVTEFFKPQNIILDITLCGLFAGALYSRTCPGNCVNDNIIGSGAGYSTAYFEIPYIRAYSAAAAPVPSASSSQPAASHAPSPSAGGKHRRYRQQQQQQ
ncbi:GH16 domain-containing protein [Mycena indigotica]|uniref:GH16 domain-containing protein n=1 Tax=Mycena indigotica TaxID=2126181 RepID=A0A8H6SEC9_9AGAR|nr:GH16 domain-containing protein [Mycena indigotica]KAF7296787.1 GH16 domain-containing protein [Mycena indigotica]